MSQPTTTGTAATGVDADADSQAAPRTLNAVERSNARKAVVAASMVSALARTSILREALDQLSNSPSAPPILGRLSGSTPE